MPRSVDRHRHALWGAVLVAACSGGGDSSAPSISAVIVNPSTLSLNGVGASGSLAATVLGALGSPVANAKVTWTAEPSTIATVAANGVSATVTAVAEGTATVRAASGGISGTATVTVTRAPVARVTVSIAPTSINVGQTAQATARTFDGANRELTGRTITFTSGNPSVATVSPTGLVTGVARGGPVLITATSEGASEGASLTVLGVLSVSVAPKTVTLARGTTTQLASLTAVDPGVSSTVTWTSRNPTVASVSATGLVTANAIGSTFVVATAVAEPAKRDSARITVPDPCTPIPYRIGDVIAGTLTELDCNGREDDYEVSFGSAVFYSVSLTAGSAQIIWPIVSVVGQGLSAPAGATRTVFALAPAGTYTIRVQASGAPPALGTYTMQAAVNPPFDCGFVFSALGVSHTFALTANCPRYPPQGLTGNFVSQIVLVTIPANKLFRVTGTAAGFPLRFELRDDAVGTVVATAFAPGAGQQAVLTFTPTVQSHRALYVTSQTAGALGNFTLTIDP